MAFAKSEEIKTKSPHRVEPSCPYYNECGGCNTMHFNYDKQLEFKENKVKEVLKKLTPEELNTFIERVVSLSDEEYYNKIHEYCKNKYGTNYSKRRIDQQIKELIGDGRSMTGIYRTLVYWYDVNDGDVAKVINT